MTATSPVEVKHGYIADYLSREHTRQLLRRRSRDGAHISRWSAATEGRVKVMNTLLVSRGLDFLFLCHVFGC